jgi:sugar/nucleoside kinase (ribokinase family)
MSVGIVGGLSIDHLVNEQHGARFNCLGGPGLYAALGARLVAGTDVRLAARLPQSTPAFWRVLRAAGIDLTSCTIVPDVPRVWILNSTRGRRLVPVEPPSGLEFDTGSVDPEPPVVPPATFFDRLLGVLYCAPDEIPRHDPTVHIGVDPDQLQVLRRGDDYWHAVTTGRAVLLPSRVQLAAVAGDPRAATRELAGRLGVSVVARLDVDGMYAVDADGARWVIRDSRVDVRDTTGAGDSSAGAIVAAVSAGADLATAAAFGVSAARVVLSGWGHTALTRADPMTQPLAGIRITRE